LSLHQQSPIKQEAQVVALALEGTQLERPRTPPQQRIRKLSEILSPPPGHTNPNSSPLVYRPTKRPHRRSVSPLQATGTRWPRRETHASRALKEAIEISDDNDSDDEEKEGAIDRSSGSVFELLETRVSTISIV
jgi:hypothetical protein